LKHDAKVNQVFSMVQIPMKKILIYNSSKYESRATGEQATILQYSHEV